MSAPEQPTTPTRSRLICDDAGDYYGNECDDEGCSVCGGNGYLDECDCGDDTCCCLHPTPMVCPECDGDG